MNDADDTAPWASSSEAHPPPEPAVAAAPPAAQPPTAPPPPPAASWSAPGTVQAQTAPLSRINRRAGWSLGLAICSIFFGGIILSVIALVLAFQAQAMARQYGTTSADSRVRWAKIISIIAIAVWVLIIVIVIANSGSNSTG